MILANTIPELLKLRANLHPDRPIYTFLNDAGTEESLTWAELDRKASSLASFLSKAASPGERAILVLPPGLDYICAFFACLYSGVIAVPTYPINPGRKGHAADRLRTIIADCRPRIVLTNSRLISGLQKYSESLLNTRDVTWIATTAIEDQGTEWQRPAIDPASVAFLQYTSGSTADPKGVMVSHASLMHNQRAIQLAFQNSEASRIVGWLPLFHDMGLIGNILQTLYLGSTAVLMAPTTFIQAPLCWLEAISKYRADISGGPNFGYELCLKKISREQSAHLDLSCWRIAFNGAEPVRQDTMDRFAEAFAHCGFRREAFFACYGLAEATLMVSGGPPANNIILHLDRAALAQHKVVTPPDAGDAQPIAGCGTTAVDHEIAVVNPDSGERVSSSAVGEIWIKGPSVALGYWNRPDITQQTFQAKITGTGEGPFLRTGDLGFFSQGQVFITGRHKDLIIVRGRNYYPQDIEKSCGEAHPACHKGRSVAFSLEAAKEEGLTVLQEVEAGSDVPFLEICASLRRAIVRQHGLQPTSVALLQLGSILKTTSNKVQRVACRAAFLAGKMPVLFCDSGQTPAMNQENAAGLTAQAYRSLQPEFRVPALEACLLGEIEQILKRPVSPADLKLPVTALGMDSLNIADLASRIERQLKVRIGLADILESASVTGLVAAIAQQMETDDPAATAATVQEPARAEHPLSFGQQAFWMIDKTSDAPENNLASAVLLGKDTDIKLLGEAFALLRERHPALRTVYSWKNGNLVQKYEACDGAAFTPEIIDSSSWDHRRLRQQITEAAKRRFEIPGRCFFRVHFYLHHERGPVMLLVFHHSIIDFWSVSIIISELTKIYSSLRSATPISLPVLQADYPDFLRWQQEFVQGARGEKAWKYWQKHLQGPLPVLDLSNMGVSNPVAVDEQGATGIVLGEEHFSRLKSAASRHSVTLYSYLLAAFAVLLQRHTGQDDLIIGAPAAGRGGHPDFRSVVGYFVNSLPLRFNLSGDPLFPDLVKQVQQVLTQGLRYQDFPFSLLVQRLNPQRYKARTPVFQALFVWQQSPFSGLSGLAPLTFGQKGAKWESDGLAMEAVPVEGQPARFDLTLFATECDSELRATLKYRTSTFDPAMIAGFAKQFVSLLTEMAKEPGRQISEFPLLSPEEEALIVRSFAAQPALRREMSFVELVAAQAAATPDQLAVTDDQITLNYRELNEHADRLTQYLRLCGAGPDQKVAVFLPRGTGAVIAILAILKAGAAYLPLDIHDPASRLAAVLEDAKVSLVVSNSATADSLPKRRHELILLDVDLGISATSAPAAPADYSPSQLAYVIYTSGSTGTPKGVLIQNDSLLNLLKGLRQDIYSHFGDRRLKVGLNAPLFFDASVKQLVCLAIGHSLHIVPETARRDPLMLGDFIDRHQLDVIDCTPTQAEMLYASGAASKTERTVLLVGGEAISDSLWKRLAARPLPAINVYGPTECTVDAAVHRIMQGDPPTIGRTLSTGRVYILDRHLRAVPPGVPGEIFISGTSVARGYNARPDLTAEKFLPDPFAIGAGTRMYRSGDGGRFLKDGKIECLGRLDRQAKVRGFRIELGEIESALASYRGVAEAAVVLHELPDKTHSLAAYIVKNVDSLRMDALKKHIQRRLPEYMVPATIDVVPAMPTSPNGKRDLKALPAPATLKREQHAAPSQPGSSVEAALVFLWQKVLRVDKVGIHDDFFALGGHSLMATRIVARLQEVFELEMPLLALFFEEPTIANLARLLADTPLGKKQTEEIVMALEDVDMSGNDSAIECAAGAAGSRRS